MKVLLLVTSLKVGGAERIVIDLADHLAFSGYEVKVVHLAGSRELQPRSKEIELISLSLKKNPFSILVGFFNLCRVVNNWKPDILHAHQFHAILFSRLLKLIIRDLLLVSSAHNKIDGGKLRRFVYRFTDFLSTVNTNVSEEALQEFLDNKSFSFEKSVAVTNGIDLNKFRFSYDNRIKLRRELGVSDFQTMWLAVGRLHKQKDYPNLLMAFSFIKRNRVDAKLFIVGEGRLKDDLSILVDELDLENDVCFLGLRGDVNSLMSAADFFVLSSAWEGFGLVVAEAMACERVVIATDSGGVAEVLGDAGFLVPTANSNYLFSAMINAEKLTVKQREELGKKARDRICNLYSSEASFAKWVDIYSELK